MISFIFSVSATAKELKDSPNASIPVLNTNNQIKTKINKKGGASPTQDDMLPPDKSENSEKVSFFTLMTLPLSYQKRKFSTSFINQVNFFLKKGILSDSIGSDL